MFAGSARPVKSIHFVMNFNFQITILSFYKILVSPAEDQHRFLNELGVGVVTGRSGQANRRVSPFS